MFGHVIYFPYLCYGALYFLPLSHCHGISLHYLLCMSAGLFIFTVGCLIRWTHRTGTAEVIGVQRDECPILSCKGEYQVGWRLYFTLLLQLACLDTLTDITNIQHYICVAMK